MFKWHRPINALEEEFYVCNLGKNGAFNLLFRMEISSSERVTEEQFRKAFQQLMRNCENLRACIKERDGKTYYAEFKDVQLDFQFVKSKTRQEIEKTLKAKSFSFDTGPLWRAVVLDEENENNYAIFFYYCHAITDGQTCFRIFKMLLELLENQLNGEEMNTNQLGKLSYGNEVIQAVKEERERLEKDPPLKERLLSEYNKMLVAEPLMERIFKQGKVDDDRLVSFESSLSEYDTKLLVSKCKDNGVKVNSALTAALNVAHIDVLQKRGIVQDSYKIISSHWVSFRRHIEHGKEALGSILGNYVYSEDLSPAQVSSFWDYTKKLDKDLHAKLTGKDVVTQEALKDIGGLVPDVNATETPFYTYHVSNYTSLDIGDQGKIKARSLYRQCALGNTVACLAYIFYTFQGRLCFFTDCIPSYVDPDMLNAVQSETMSVLMDVI